MSTYTEAEQALLINTAKASIEYGLSHGQEMDVQLNDYDAKLTTEGASFVTINLNKQLRGCIGSLQAHQPLIQDVKQNAYRAAFADPRFPKLRADEFAKIDLHISVLSAPEPMSFNDEVDLLRQLRPAIDGLILQDGSHRGTFLPQVWDTLPTRHLFFTHLKQKAGLKPEHWSDNIAVWRYTVESID